MAVVGSPSCFARRLPPKTPQDPADRSCINLRFPTHGGLHGREFKRGGRELDARRRREKISDRSRFSPVSVEIGLATLFPF
jgi:hypothetical protein